MLKAAQERLQFVKRMAEENKLSGSELVGHLKLTQLDMFLSYLSSLPFDPSNYFKKFCKNLEERLNILQACLLLDYMPITNVQVTFYRRKAFKPEIASDLILGHIRQYELNGLVRLDNDSPLLLENVPGTQFVYIIPIIPSKHRHCGSLGKVVFWLDEENTLPSCSKHIKYFAQLLADKLVAFRFAKADYYIKTANNFTNRDIKKVMQRCLGGVHSIMGCNYSVGLVLNRVYSEVSTNAGQNAHARRTFEVVKENVIGHRINRAQRSQSTGLLIDESEGILSLVIREWDKNPNFVFKGLTFHQIEKDSTEYVCEETGEKCHTLRGSEDERQEVTIHYAPLAHEGVLLGFLKLSYREKSHFNELDRAIIQKFCSYLATRIRNSFIYSMNVDQSRFLPDIKSLFEEADRLDYPDFKHLEQLLNRLSGLIMETTGIDTIAIGYLTKNADSERIIRFPYPVGWKPEARKTYRELPVSKGLVGLAVRIKRNVYLSPVEEAKTPFDPEPTVYVDESKPHFVDIRKHPQYAHDPNYKKLSDYYLHVHSEKVYADFIFLIEYKNVVLGVIDVEVTQKNWDRFIGIGYIHFFKTMANMLALLFYRIRLAEEHGRILQALRRLSDAALMSPMAVIRSILSMLRSIYHVEKAKIILCNILKRPIEISLLEGHIEKYDHLFIGYDLQEMKRFCVPGDRIDSDNIFLLELQHLVQQEQTFFLYIPDVHHYKTKTGQVRIQQKFERFRSHSYFNSYMGIYLGDENRSLGVLELVSVKKNAFEELLIDQNFLKYWVAEINQALKYSFMEREREKIYQSHDRPRQMEAPHIIKQKNIVRILPQDQIERKFGIVGSGPSISELREEIIRASEISHLPILIEGDSGTGKELVARAIHRISQRRSNKFVPLNCGSLTETLIEDQLFGHEKNAFTNANETRKGAFETANGGTLFLDEISSLPLGLQAKLLRVLDDFRITRLGSHELIKVDVQVVAATWKKLKEMVRNGEFRRDLFYRLDVIKIQTIPLKTLIREDERNLLQFISHFVYQSKSHQNKVHGISRELYDRLLHYHFPGNMRELRNIIEKTIFHSAIKPVLNCEPERLGLDEADEKRATESVDYYQVCRNFKRRNDKRLNVEKFTVLQISEYLTELLDSSLSPEERIYRFLDEFGAMDIQIARLLMGSGATWSRKLLKEKYRLFLDKKSNLYLKESAHTLV